MQRLQRRIAGKSSSAGSIKDAVWVQRHQRKTPKPQQLQHMNLEEAVSNLALGFKGLHWMRDNPKSQGNYRTDHYLERLCHFLDWADELLQWENM